MKKTLLALAGRFSVGVNNGFGGTAPLSHRPITTNNQYISFGIMYEL